MNFGNLVLDIGCGTDNTYFAHERDGVNCDIDVLKRRISNFVRCDATNLPFKQQVFRKVLAYHIIEHLINVSKFIEEITRVLQPDGRIIIVTPHIYSKTSFKDPTHLHHFNIDLLKRVFKKFKITIRGHVGLWLPIKGNVNMFKKLSLFSFFPLLSKSLKLEGTIKKERILDNDSKRKCSECYKNRCSYDYQKLFYTLT